jgi:F0F1-type ATP synthase assembly protein I
MAIDYAISLLVPFALCFFLGQWLDKALSIAPWGTFGGLLLGMTLGVGVLYKKAVMTSPTDPFEHDEDSPDKPA